MDRREFLKNICMAVASGGIVGGLSTDAWPLVINKDYDTKKHYYGMGIDVDKCIGCGRCMQACKTENNVPSEPFFFRTWVERYVIKSDNSVSVKTIGMGPEDSADLIVEKD